MQAAVESFIPSLKVAFPPRSWFALLPSPSTACPTIPPSASKYPFAISESLYTAFLDPRVPLSIAAVYAAAVHLLNSRCNGKPYYIATTRIFRAFVLLHNLFLAIYSLWTFIGMAGAIHRSIVTSRGVPGVVESLCKIRPETRFEGVEIREMEGGVGLWEEGLAFYGWLFYLSKFYEVLDTAIIIAKGKKSSLLQTYHHAGAMICMWAGIRFMSPPIWVFCIFNSLIHTLMYFYYTLSTVRIPVPNALKRSLTSLQITQFVVGGSLAALHLFVYFTPTTYLPGSLTEAVPSSSASAFVSSHGMPVGVKAPGMVHCLSNPGEVWAVVANVVYLTPLTYLFVSFFVESYIKGGKTKGATRAATLAEKSTR
ncbi:hypothetical protein C7212DRAFT_289387 [Tuber magnatum]|uniref:Elongation of fatty acids protein n=1 Tax=Tuber magnatum TaxID=42249 RepID=A0A317T3Z2_9PEZI|nr:hypothetical protein C7212DRAFT_289387 [Tuber magnatum]